MSRMLSRSEPGARASRFIKQIVNELLRRGMSLENGQGAKRKPLRVKPHGEVTGTDEWPEITVRQINPPPRQQAATPRQRQQAAAQSTGTSARW